MTIFREWGTFAHAVFRALLEIPLRFSFVADRMRSVVPRSIGLSASACTQWEANDAGAFDSAPGRVYGKISGLEIRRCSPSEHKQMGPDNFIGKVCTSSEYAQRPYQHGQTFAQAI